MRYEGFLRGEHSDDERVRILLLRMAILKRGGDRYQDRALLNPYYIPPVSSGGENP